MGRLRVTVIVVLLAVGNSLGAADGGLVNGSFEDDGLIGNINNTDPNGWDVDVPPSKFIGYVTSTWPTDGAYNLKLTASWFVTFLAGDMATVSQEVLFDNVNRVTFDVRLATQESTAWDPGICTAVVLIDDDVVWESDFASFDIRGEYLDRSCVIDDQYRDGQPHRLALGLKMNTGGMFFEQYISEWDAIECSLSPDDGEPLAGDFDADDFVGVEDLMMMATLWLVDIPSDSPYNLSGYDDVEADGIVNFYDLAVFGDNWRTGTIQEESPE